MYNSKSMKDILRSGERISESLDYNSFIEQKTTYSFEVEKILGIFKSNKEITVVDCASGEGYGCDLIKKEFPDINLIGIDIDSETIKHSSNKYPHLSFLEGSILEIDNFLKTKSNVFISNQTFEHLSKENQLRALDHIYKNLVTGGAFMIAVPNKPVYEIFSPNNIFHIHELDHISLMALLSTQNWSSIELFGQFIPSYQKNNGFRKQKLFSMILEKLPVQILNILKSLFIPKISENDIKIESFNKTNEDSYKILIAVCIK